MKIQEQKYENFVEKSTTVNDITTEVNLGAKLKYSGLSEFYDDKWDLQGIQKIKEVKVSLEACDKTIKISGAITSELFLRKIWDNDLMNLQEQFYALFIDSKLALRAYKLINQGYLTGTSVDIRMIFMLAFNCASTGVIIAHNHPSGDPSPSRSDKELTWRISEALEFFGLKLVDHIILSETDSFSFVDHNLINPNNFKYIKAPKVECHSADCDSDVEESRNYYSNKFIWDYLLKWQKGKISKSSSKKRTKI